jgi:ribA/ribD-fused uncharacterized protein
MESSEMKQNESLAFFYKNKKNEPFSDEYDYDEKGDLIIRDSAGKIVRSIILPTYRSPTLEEYADMEKDRFDKIKEANEEYERVRKELHDAIHLPAVENEYKSVDIMVLNEKVKKADATLIGLQFQQYNIHEYSKSRLPYSAIDYRQLDEHRKYPYNVYAVQTRPFLLQDQYVRIDNSGAVPTVSKKQAPVPKIYTDKTKYRTPESFFREFKNRGKVYIGSINTKGEYTKQPPNTIIVDVSSGKTASPENKRDLNPMTESGYKGYRDFETFWRSGKKREGDKLYMQWGKMKDGSWEINEEDERMDYIEARKKVYAPLYREYIWDHKQTGYWEKVVDSGKNIVVYDYDGPKNPDGADPKDDSPAVLEVTDDMLREKINYERNPFGHGYIFAAHLAGIKLDSFIDGIELKEPDEDGNETKVNIILFGDSKDEKYGFLSIDSVHPFEFVLLLYKTVRIGYLVIMAAKFGDYNRADNLGSNNSANYEKHLGYSYKNIDGNENDNRTKWIEEAKEIMYDLNKAKFMRYPKLKDKLNATGKAILAASMGDDDILGIGESVSNNPNDWEGLNILGQTLMQLRDEFRRPTRPVKSEPKSILKSLSNAVTSISQPSSVPVNIAANATNATNTTSANAIPAQSQKKPLLNQVSNAFKSIVS